MAEIVMELALSHYQYPTTSTFIDGLSVEVVVSVYDDGSEHPAAELDGVALFWGNECVASAAVTGPPRNYDKLIAMITDVPEYKRQYYEIIEHHDEFAGFRSRERQYRDELTREYRANAL